MPGNGRQLSQLVDRVVTIRVARPSASPFGWNGVWLQFGPPVGGVNEPWSHEIETNFRSLDLAGPAPLYQPAAAISVGADGRLVMSAEFRTLGACLLNPGAMGF